MRFHFKTTHHPRRLANALRKELASLGRKLRPSEALDLFARMYGYRDWAELTRITGTVPTSLPDDLCPPEVLEGRRRLRVAVLSEVIPPEAAARVLERLLRPHAKGARSTEMQVAGTASILTWRQEGDAWFAEIGERMFRIKPAGPEVFQWQGQPGFALRSGIISMKEKAPQSYHVGHGLDATLEEAKNHAELVALWEMPEIWQGGEEIEVGPELHSPWGTPDEAYAVSQGILKVSAMETGYRVEPALMAGMPEPLRVRVDAGGYGWYHEKQRALLVAAFQERFGAKARRFSELELASRFPTVSALLKGDLKPSPAATRRRRKEIVEAESSLVGVGLRWPKAAR